MDDKDEVKHDCIEYPHPSSDSSMDDKDDNFCFWCLLLSTCSDSSMDDKDPEALRQRNRSRQFRFLYGR